MTLPKILLPNYYRLIIEKVIKLLKSNLGLFFKLEDPLFGFSVGESFQGPMPKPLVSFVGSFSKICAA